MHTNLPAISLDFCGLQALKVDHPLTGGVQSKIVSFEGCFLRFVSCMPYHCVFMLSVPR